jgi:hypothetical protein
MNINRLILTAFILASISLFLMGPAINSNAQVNQTSNNHTNGNKSSSSTSSDSPQTTRINGSTVATANENATLLNNH